MNLTRTRPDRKTNFSTLGRCVVCTSERSQSIFAVGEVPIHPFCPPAALGLEPGFGTLDIVACSHCGHIYNAGFDPNRVEELYAANVLTNTPVSDTMLNGLQSTADFILSHGPENPCVVDVGGGSGMLSILLARRAGEVHLVEPSRALVPEQFARHGVILHSSMFPPSDFAGRQFDILLSRQVLEHIPSPAGFLAAMRSHVRPDGVVFLELPSEEYIESTLSIVDFHYPHVHYYRRRELEVLFARAGFEIVETINIKNGHDIGFILRPVTPSAPSVPAVSTDARAFADGLAGRRRMGNQRLAALKGTIALYGANAYSQAILGLYPDAVKYGIVFDDTPMYEGQRAYGPGGDIEIRPPDTARLKTVDAVIITAYLHDVVINKKLQSFGFPGAVYTVRADALSGVGGAPPSLFQA
jgi:2-polyprenyl-3-methyl-5-hydroxy-6-metoxy-1,4-benzoquinol methylase